MKGINGHKPMALTQIGEGPKIALSDTMLNTHMADGETKHKNRKISVSYSYYSPYIYIYNIMV